MFKLSFSKVNLSSSSYKANLLAAVLARSEGLDAEMNTHMLREVRRVRKTLHAVRALKLFVELFVPLFQKKTKATKTKATHLVGFRFAHLHLSMELTDIGLGFETLQICRFQLFNAPLASLT